MNVTDNYSNTTSSSNDEFFMDTLDIIQGSIYIPIFCAGIGNNLLTILIMLFNQDMRTVTNCYLLNLAISDTLPLIVSLPFEISFLPIEVPLGHLGCRIRALLAETSTNVSILTISAFTVERYLAVCGPSRISSLSTIRRAIKIQIFIWFIAMLSSSPYFYFTEKIHEHCLFDQKFQSLVTICLYISAICFFLLPASVLCLLYALMAQRLYNVSLLHQEDRSKSNQSDLDSVPMSIKVRQSDNDRWSRNIRLLHNPSSRTLIVARQSTLHSANNSSPNLLMHIQAMKKSAFKMLFAVVIAFIICYAPFHVQRLITSCLNVLYLSVIQKRTIRIFYFISGILYYIGSTVNPIFYHLFSRKYRSACCRAMKRIIYCGRSRRGHSRKLQSPNKNTLLRHYPNTHRRPMNSPPPIGVMHRPAYGLISNTTRRKTQKEFLHLSLPQLTIE